MSPFAQQAVSLGSPTATALRGGYDPVFFDRLALVEDKHFWFRSRNRLIFQLTRELTRELKPGFSILEVGCGTGNALRVLRRASPAGILVGLELWFEGLRHAQKRSADILIQGDVRDYPFRDPFNLICMFDVLEHVSEDRATLLSLYQNLLPGGALLLTVPAHQSLWSYFDEAAQHCRRYSVRDISQKLNAAGFEVEFVSHFMACIFPLVWLVRKMRGRSDLDPKASQSRSTDEFALIPVVNQLLTALLTLEVLWVARRHRLPFGSSLVVIARKPA